MTKKRQEGQQVSEEVKQVSEEVKNTQVEKNIAPESIFIDKVREDMVQLDAQHPLIEFTKKGQVIECVFVSRRIIKTEYGDSPLWDVDIKGELFSLWPNVVLENQRISYGITEGSVIAIQYNGKVKTKTGGMSYRDFSVFMDR